MKDRDSSVDFASNLNKKWSHGTEAKKAPPHTEKIEQFDTPSIQQKQPDEINDLSGDDGPMAAVGSPHMVEMIVVEEMIFVPTTTAEPGEQPSERIEHEHEHKDEDEDEESLIDNGSDILPAERDSDSVLKSFNDHPIELPSYEQDEDEQTRKISAVVKALEEGQRLRETYRVAVDSPQFYFCSMQRVYDLNDEQAFALFHRMKKLVF